MTNSEAIDFIKNALSVREASIAAMLDVTTMTLDRWKDENLLDSSGKSQCLKALANAVLEAERSGVPGKLILNLLNEPLDDLSDHPTCSTLIHVIKQMPDSQLIAVCIKAHAKDYA